MLHSGASAGSRTRINILKKVKVKGQWKLCSVVPEASGRLKDRERVNGRTEVHPAFRRLLRSAKQNCHPRRALRRSDAGCLPENVWKTCTPGPSTWLRNGSQPSILRESTMLTNHFDC